MASNISKLSESALEREKSRPMGVAVEHTALLILGMHRSGTSAVTRVMNLLGADLPTNIMLPKAENNEAGFWESMDLFRLNDEILKSAGSSWDDWRRFNPDWVHSPTSQVFRARALEVVERDFSRSPCFVLKDPRICRLLPFWLDVFREFGSDVKSILPLRNPLEIAASLKKRDGFSPAKSYVLWLRHVLDAEKATRKLPRVFIAYDNLLDDWRGAVGQVSERLGIAWPRRSAAAEVEIDRFLDERHRHHSIDEAGIDQRSEVAGWVSGASRAIAKLLADPYARKPQKRLDAIRAEFNRANDALGAVLLAEELAREEAELSATGHAAESAEARAQLSKRESRVQVLEQQAADKDGAIGQLRTTVTERDKKIAELEQRSTEQQQSIVQLRETLAIRDGSISALERRAKDHQKLMDETAFQLNETNSRIADCFEEVATISGMLREKENEAQIAQKTIEQIKRQMNVELQDLRREKETLESRLRGRFSETAALTRLLKESEDQKIWLHRVATILLSGLGSSKVRILSLVPASLRYAAQKAKMKKNGIFDGAAYLIAHPDVAKSGQDPLRHYISFGMNEGRGFGKAGGGSDEVR